jgi:hypothetical protein
MKIASYFERKLIFGGPGSSVGIGTGYGLDGPGVESRWGPTKPPVQRVPGLSGSKAAGA